VDLGFCQIKEEVQAKPEPGDIRGSICPSVIGSHTFILALLGHRQMPRVNDRNQPKPELANAAPGDAIPGANSNSSLSTPGYQGRSRIQVPGVDLSNGPVVLLPKVCNTLLRIKIGRAVAGLTKFNAKIGYNSCQ
jgi:hypothetical protein